MWDQRHLMDEWLEEQGDLIDQADFNGVQVRHYRLHRETTSICTPAIAYSLRQWESSNLRRVSRLNQERSPS
jgi:hypothetical protein